MDDREHDPSFDPRRWSGARAAPQPTHDATSFDPRSWAPARPAAAAPAQSPPAPPSPPSALSAVREPGEGSSVQLLPFAVSAAILLAGAGLAWSARPATPLTTAQAAQAASTVQVAPVPRALGVSRRTLILASTAEVGDALLSAGAAPDQSDAAARAVATALGTPPGNIRLVFDVGGGAPGTASLSFVEATRDDGSGVVLTRRADGRLQARAMAAKLTTRIEIVRGELDAESFYNSAVAAGVNDRLIGDFANAFAFDFDMQREVGPGDIFEAGFEQRYNAAGDPVGAPVLVYASLATAAKSRALYRFSAPGGEAEWFDSNGRSTRRALMRTPIDSARISSRFGPRTHPILGFVKVHRGTDFAAPTGTPIFASGDATVDFAGPKGANGNFVRLRHDNGWVTLYLHMNRIVPGIVPGQRVLQGRQIGEVGTTGRSTGPHLHYEVHIDGNAVDPLGIDTGTGRSLDAAAVAAFRRQRDGIDTRRATAG